MKNKTSFLHALPLKKFYQKEIIAGLSRKQKQISPKFLYDERGSKIFQEICKLKEYYLVRAESEILKKNAEEISKLMGEKVILIEPGCGSCTKVRYLLPHLNTPHAYVAMDISKAFLFTTAHELQSQFPMIPIYTIANDYTKALTFPDELIPGNPKSGSRGKNSGKKVTFFPGSTIGNMHPSEAKTLLQRISKLMGLGGGLLIGVDMKKSARVLELAYDDPKGVTANFNFNLLDRLNREFFANFKREQFSYEVKYNRGKSRVEMNLVSQEAQEIKVAGQNFKLQASEKIHTENSYKYTVKEFEALAERAGFRLIKTWKDRAKLFCVYYFESR